MSTNDTKKPREFWIPEDALNPFYASDGKEALLVHVIEKSAYDNEKTLAELMGAAELEARRAFLNLVKERDELQAQLVSAEAAISHLREAAKEVMIQRGCTFGTPECHCGICLLQHALACTSGYETKTARDTDNGNQTKDE